jgi:hypothetical protein
MRPCGSRLERLHCPASLRYRPGAHQIGPNTPPSSPLEDERPMDIIFGVVIAIGCIAWLLERFVIEPYEDAEYERENE